MSNDPMQNDLGRRDFMKTSLKASTATVTAGALGIGFVAEIGRAHV